jgi:hypothetical protein
MKRDAAYAEAFSEAHAEACDVVEAEVRRRAMEGAETPLLHAGKPVLDGDGKVVMIRRPSDLLLIFLAKKLMPEFRDREPQATAQINIQSNSSYGSLEPARQAELDRLRAIVAVSPTPALDNGKP